MLKETFRDAIMTSPRHVSRIDEAFLEHMLRIGDILNLMGLGKPEVLPSTRIACHLAYSALVEQQPCLGHAHWYHRHDRGGDTRLPNGGFDLALADLMPHIVGITVHNN